MLQHTRQKGKKKSSEYRNTVLGDAEQFGGTAAEEACSHLSALSDWLAGYRAEKRASQMSGKEWGCAIRNRKGWDICV